ncbi:MAG: MBL fold metallo-hydrolase [Methylocystaceae bacterium]
MYIDLSNQFRVIRPQGLGFPYCYSLLAHGRTAVLIDPGAGPLHLEKAGALDADLVLLSHFHFDHINGFPFFHHAQFMVGEEERETYEDSVVHHHHHGYERWAELLGSERPVYEAPAIAGSSIRPGFHPLLIAGTFHDGMSIDLGGLTLVALAAPGHTVGHYVFYFPEAQVLYAADIDLSKFGPWYANTFSSVSDFLRSLNMVHDLPFTTFVSSHRRPLNRAQALAGIDQYRDILLERTERIYQLLERPQTLSELSANCVTVVQHDSDYHIFWEMVMMEKHLDYLQEQGRIEQEGKIYRQKR